MIWVVETSRLKLRQFDLQDAASMYVLNSDPKVIRYTVDPPFNSIEHARQFIQGYSHYQKHGFGRWAVCRKPDLEFLGWCGLKQLSETEVDLGFRLSREHWGQGYATEAAKACIEVGFSSFDMPFIIGRAVTANKASIRVLEKTGMQFWKQAPCDGFEDAVYYRIFR